MIRVRTVWSQADRNTLASEGGVVHLHKRLQCLQHLHEQADNHLDRVAFKHPDVSRRLVATPDQDDVPDNQLGSLNLLLGAIPHHLSYVGQLDKLLKVFSTLARGGVILAKLSMILLDLFSW